MHFQRAVTTYVGKIEITARIPGRKPMQTGTVINGENDKITSIPESVWMEELMAAPPHIARRLEFMTPGWMSWSKGSSSLVRDPPGAPERKTR